MSGKKWKLRRSLRHFRTLHWKPQRVKLVFMPYKPSLINQTTCILAKVLSVGSSCTQFIISTTEPWNWGLLTFRSSFRVQMHRQTHSRRIFPRCKENLRRRRRIQTILVSKQPELECPGREIARISCIIVCRGRGYSADRSIVLHSNMLTLIRVWVTLIFTSGSCLLVFKYFLQKGEGGSVNES